MTREEFNSTWMPYADTFYKVAFYLLESEAAASDAVQEVYLKLWTTREGLGKVLNPSAYGTMMVRNHCLDIIRRESSRRREELDENMAEERSTDTALDFKSRLKYVEEAMKTLPDIQQKILRMRVWEEMEYDEIARELGLSQVNVRVQLTRARARLRKLTK